MAERSMYSAEVKAAVMAALLAGQSARSVAKAYKIPEGTARTWKARAKQRPVDGGRIGDLIIENLEAILTAVKEIVIRVSQDPQWIREQDASELGVFLGILSDKAFRIIEALPRPDGDGGDAGLLAGSAGESEAARG